MIKDLIIRNRSYRRFDSKHEVTKEQLVSLIELARYSASASNRQLIRYCLVNTPDKNDQVFSCLKWAGYLTEWEGPEVAERPSAYIIVLVPNAVNAYIGHDTGIACQSILLGAIEMGLGGCMFGSVDRVKLQKQLKLPEEFKIELVIAIGKPVEKVQIDECDKDSIRYWRDSEDVHHVPKLKLEDLIIKSS